MRRKELTGSRGVLVPVAGIVASVCGLLAVLCVANRPRFWWQEAFCGLAPYWLPAAFVMLVLLVCYARRCMGVAMWFVWVGIISYAYLCVAMGAKVWPYVFHSPWVKPPMDESSVLTGLWIDSWGQHEDLSALVRLIQDKSASLVILSGTVSGSEQEPALQSLFPHYNSTTPQRDGQVRLWSQFSFADHAVRNLGIRALPGGLFSLQLANGKKIEVGVLSLLPSANQLDFERNRISSRRLSALIRSSRLPRIVAAEFSTTPFSQLVAIYPEQARVRPLLHKADAHFSRIPGYSRDLIADSTVFVSKDFTQITFEQLRVPWRERFMLFFRVQLLDNETPVARAISQ